MPKQAVLLLAHGTPETVEQIPEYLRNVVSGRPLPQHVIEEIQHRYGLIGRSPLTELTMEQARLTAAHLAAGGVDVPVYVGMRNWRPYIPDVVKQMRAEGIEEAAVICVAPQNSRTSVGLYRRAVQAEAGSLSIDFTESWPQHPLLIQAFAERLRTALAKLTAETGQPVPVLFTAHSVPCRTVQTPAASEGAPRHWPGEGADPYAQEAKHTAELVAQAVPEIPRWFFAFQSQGASGGPWIGPTVEHTLDTLAEAGQKALILQPIGFLCDHVEILYDVDIAFKQYAHEKGIRLERPESLNGSSTLASAIADLARQGLQRLRSGA
ncbi:ferrochelatase [Occallatibacter riparius]|uniref:Ferrochelatase n=1 Tax=Occallatibacter riparius TaxID=1002689 RepID=A0A9J7BID1_9BACT|nr:ferrochelatase [Occallatibacter riparius]UWZ82552.1 ferrochelatase [Occallatibacter riparius]